MNGKPPTGHYLLMLLPLVAALVAAPGIIITGQAVNKTTTGAIFVDSEPPADFYVDDVLIGATPQQAGRLSEGYHKVVLAKAGYSNYTASIYVSAGKRKRLNVSMIPEETATGTGSFLATSKPTGANLYLDGMFRGKTPKKVHNLTAGFHEIIIAKQGYRNYTTKVYVFADKTAKINATLWKKTVLKTP